VYVPLRRALDEVAWEVRARSAVREALAQEPTRVVDSRSQVARHGVDLVVVILGKAKDAEAARQRLSQRVEKASGIKPSIEVLAVPDANAFAGLESTLLTPRPAAAAVEAQTALAVEAQTAAARVKAALTEVWPTSAAGDILGVTLEQGDEGALKIRAVHWGPQLAEAAREALEKSLSATLEGATLLESVPVTADPITRKDGDLTFIARVATTARVARSISGVGMCLARPDVGETKPPLTPEDKRLASALDALLQTEPGLTTMSGTSFELRLTRGACAPPEETPTVPSKEAPPAAPGRPR
jgi:hypothetical protein